ncbi:MAG: Alpha-D-glucose 1-phosphate phosphatase YihX [Candidatus Celerinatantimonas neptuna]|nr:MAG: Alpha-D-glucose 1-phosphate phosphatase YihX [Candidatus Celerinatantimonas neptuna]
MSSCQIRNVVFDIGNVMVRWSPIEIIRLTFGDSSNHKALAESIFHSELWRGLNRGEYTEQEVKAQLQHLLDLPKEITESLFYYIRRTLILLFGSTELLKKLIDAGYTTYALTDNVIEIVDYLKKQYDFWDCFSGIIVSAEVGCLKPDAEIFNHLINQYQVDPQESVFIDDLSKNIEGSRRLGFSGIQFSDAVQCEQELKKLGLKF